MSQEEKQPVKVRGGEARKVVELDPHLNLITFAWKENSTSPYYVWMDSYSTAPPPVGIPRYIGDGLSGVVVIV